jgi:hypothetical protein
MNTGGTYVRLSDDDFCAEALRIVSSAQERGIILRILGGLGIYIHSRENAETRRVISSLRRLGEGKPLFTDLDLVAYGSQRKDVIKHMTTLGLKPDNMLNMMCGNKRSVYSHTNYTADIFFDKLEFCHAVVFGNAPGKGRLEIDYPTISLSDLVLEKLQIHQLNVKDLHDLIVLFIGHEVGHEGRQDQIDSRHLARTLADDWGFWYDATSNLKLIKEATQDYLCKQKLDAVQTRLVCDRIDVLLQAIEEETKSRKWKLRATVGTSKAWYREVEELMR